ncbi:phenylalanine--tRNA ligase subunit alpha [Candidatus Collierbacteria bacterium RIFOXYD1_FULL_40_9]|uniref:phenylalanine--tRNA ligase n=1 Tax=Candidatus Collierbacteria bacterium RIFOXYD1_FULL_40_9 TaxID=1817731 RepID=A0A1F5FWN7_9BACT|nr:MAG: phenylalanine--tRNA ligase subunit alpha [Candidatus Collierbacteria bacterium RIFOXYD1_FULL_40_9]
MPAYQEELEKIANQFEVDLKSATTFDDLNNIEIKYLGRQGFINNFLKIYPPKGNPELGKDVNQLKQRVSAHLEERRNKLSYHSPKIDLTLPLKDDLTGSTHLISRTIEEIEDIFAKIGFARRRYPEIDTDWYYAEGLNIPKGHPARDDQETFYLTNDFVLTAHTSNGQLHEMENQKPPIRMINIGKTYRRQADTSHNPMFHQFEGLVVDIDISIANLISITNYFAENYFGVGRKTRLRPHHFQFTEPSFEIDISCDLCSGTGVIDSVPCKMCKSGWLELGGAGMVHRNVLKNGDLDPDIYSGFAFGWGVERVLLMRSGLKIADLRNLFTDDIRFLGQFK